MSKPVFRRIIAYLIDILIVALVASALSRVSFLNPYLEKYDEAQDKVQALVSEDSTDASNLEELLNSQEIQDLSYEVTYYGAFLSIYTIVLSVLYFVVFQYYTGGKTLGKLLAKIEVVSNDKKDISLLQLLKRSIVINSLVTSSIMTAMLLLLNKNNYLNYVRFIQLIDYGLLIVSLGFVIYREDGLGLHDLFAGTRVILSSEKEMFLNDSVKEAKVVNEKPSKKKESK